MSKHRRVGVTVLLLLGCVATAFVLSPGIGSNETPAMAVESSGISSGEAGMRVYLDPETGEITSRTDVGAPVELDAELQNALRHDTEGLEIKHHANGAVSIDLQERYQEASVVKVDANGRMIFCTDTAANLEKTLADQTPVTPEVE